MGRITENDIKLPALYILYTNGKANTTKIKTELIDLFQPSGEDNAKLPGRSDTKFTQIVRNLMGSHYESNGMSGYTTKDPKGYFSLTQRGTDLVASHLDEIEYLFKNHFAYEDAKNFAAKAYTQGKKQKLLIYSEEERITEGKLTTKTLQIKERSLKLREAAIEHYRANGKLSCYVCGFDFEATYGEHGKGYIQIHHERPVCQYSDEGVDEYISQALQYVKPLCANCHCMIHRHSTPPLSIETLKKIISDNKQTSQL